MGNCLNRGLSRITRITRIMGLGDGGQESGIGVPSYQVRKSRAYKALPQESSLLQRKRRAYKALPQESSLLQRKRRAYKALPQESSLLQRKRRAYKALPQESSLLQRKRRAYKALPQESSLLPSQKASGLQSPPTREFPPTEEGLTENPRRGFPTPFNLFVNITGIYKIIESFTIARLETSPAFEEFMSFCRARRLGCRWFW